MSNKKEHFNRTCRVVGKFSVLAVSLWLTAAAESVMAQDDTRKELLELTGNKRVKVAWSQNNHNNVQFFDTNDGVIQDLPLVNGSAPLMSTDGTKVFNHSGQTPADRVVSMYDLETKKVTELAKGPGNNLLAVWQDPKTKKHWCYVNESGDHNENWNEAKGGKIYRFPVDNPAARELFWDRTSSHSYLMFSEDGTRACFEPSWGNIGQLKLVFDANGKVDQDKSEFKTFGGGCFPSMAPDNSYRLFRLDGDHRSISMCDADNANVRKVVTTSELFGNGMTWLTRWSKHPRYMTCMAPDSEQAMIWLGRFDENFTKIEKWVRVSKPNSPKCWLSQAWIEP